MFTGKTFRNVSVLHVIAQRAHALNHCLSQILASTYQPCACLSEKIIRRQICIFCLLRLSEKIIRSPDQLLHSPPQILRFGLPQNKVKKNTMRRPFSSRIRSGRVSPSEGEFSTCPGIWRHQICIFCFSVKKSSGARISISTGLTLLLLLVLVCHNHHLHAVDPLRYLGADFLVQDGLGSTT